MQRIVWKAFVDEINVRMRKTEVWWIPLRILGGSYEIVAGIQYDLQVLGGESNCPKEVQTQHKHDIATEQIVIIAGLWKEGSQ